MLIISRCMDIASFVDFLVAMASQGRHRCSESSAPSQQAAFIPPTAYNSTPFYTGDFSKASLFTPCQHSAFTNFHHFVFSQYSSLVVRRHHLACSLTISSSKAVTLV
ncbi:predicted protein [Lichtheimia corymbifera JMRC:FSU:9682]|uniref:Uncharacterized protein n=1 Tax=Lichtheimia corymbifera JMRC:FSU:9682 TaxID=1263082 RepID=A0A068SAD9_9FUNG|nr:predicted protein [Lichtheimia corymbifera JMRC:FSU:9682]